VDSRKRTIVKTLLWRFIASGTTVVVVFALSGNVVLGLTAAAIGIPLKLLMYYFYERFWMTTIEWGRTGEVGFGE
jgi:adenylylsulfate kinase